MTQTTQPSLKLYFAPRTRSFTALWLLEELGVGYELDSFDLNSGRHKQPDYLALNPMGKVPLVVCEPSQSDAMLWPAARSNCTVHELIVLEQPFVMVYLPSYPVSNWEDLVKAAVTAPAPDSSQVENSPVLTSTQANPSRSPQG